MKYCRDCTALLFGENLADENDLKHESDEAEPSLCNSCGLIEVDKDGNCLTHSEHHFSESWPLVQSQ